MVPNSLLVYRPHSYPYPESNRNRHPAADAHPHPYTGNTHTDEHG